MQLAACVRIPWFMGIYARAVSDAGVCGYGGYRGIQDALLRESPEPESVGSDSVGAGAGFQVVARAGNVTLPPRPMISLRGLVPCHGPGFRFARCGAGGC